MFWRKVSRSLTPLLEDWTLTGRCSSELRAVAQEQVRHVWKAVYAMNDDERTIFLLRFVENFNKSEIAEATGLDDRTVQEYLSLALRRVRSEVHPRMGRH
jgi:RNA polymerase sigma factor (sigma-70 family)